MDTSLEQKQKSKLKEKFVSFSAKKVTSKHLFIALVIFSLGVAGLLIFPHFIGAAAPTAVNVGPANNAVSGNAVTFYSRPYSYFSSGLLIQVAYKRTDTADSWHKFGTDAGGNASDGTALQANGVRNQYTNAQGWSCAMGWGNYAPPVNCSSLFRNRIPSWSGYNTYMPTVSLASGSYMWQTRTYDRKSYGPWSTSTYFSIPSATVIPSGATPTTAVLNIGVETDTNYDGLYEPTSIGGYVNGNNTSGNKIMCGTGTNGGGVCSTGTIPANYSFNLWAGTNGAGYVLDHWQITKTNPAESFRLDPTWGGAITVDRTQQATAYFRAVGATVSPEQAAAQTILNRYIAACPILKGTTVEFGDAKGYQSITYYISARIVISSTHTYSLETLLGHEIYHVYDWRDNGVINWNENIPPSPKPACMP